MRAFLPQMQAANDALAKAQATGGPSVDPFLPELPPGVGGGDAEDAAIDSEGLLGGMRLPGGAAPGVSAEAFFGLAQQVRGAWRGLWSVWAGRVTGMRGQLATWVTCVGTCA